jgi:hypothetical protein
MMDIMKAVAGRRGATSTPRPRPANAVTGAVQSVVQAAGGYNPGFKASGAPMPFSPASQMTMNGMFGMPLENMYDRAMGIPQQPPVGVETPITPPYDLNN